MLSASTLPAVWQSGSSSRCSPSTRRPGWCRRTPGTAHRPARGPARADPWTSSCRHGSARRPGLRPRPRGWRRRRFSAPGQPELAGHRERRQLGAVAHLVGQAPADPGDRALVAQEAVQAHRLGGEAAPPTRRARSGRPPGRGGRAGGDVSTLSVGTHHTPALRSVPCSVSSSAGPSPSNTKRACPPRGLADCLASSSSRPPCIRWTTNVTGSNVTRRYLPRRPTSRSGCP